MLMDDLRQRLSRQAGLIAIGGSAALLVFALLALAMSLSGADQAEVDRQAQTALKDLEGDLEESRSDLRSEHEDLLGDLSGVDHERVTRDSRAARSMVLSLTGTSATTSSREQVVAALTTRYDFLDGDSQVVRAFLPEWLSATAAESGNGRTYQLKDVDTELVERSNRNYTYVTIAHLDPVSGVSGSEPEDEGRSEFVTLTMTTTEDGTVTDVEAYLVSSRARNELITTQGKNKDSSKSSSPTN